MKKKSERSFWNRTTRFTKSKLHKGDQMNYEIARLTVPYLRKDKDVLEPACSAGLHSHALAKYAHFWEACDLSESMIKKAKRQMVPSNLHFSVQDVTALPYAVNSFDMVVFINALHVVDHPDQALQEIRRVLRPGCILVITDMVYEGNSLARALVRLQKIFGVPTYHKWRTKEFFELIERNGFSIKAQKSIKRRNKVTCSYVVAVNKSKG